MERVAEHEAGAALARNMSAPPRMQVAIRPLARAADSGTGPAPACAPPGFRLHARIDLGDLFAHLLPASGGLQSPRTRLARLVLVARCALDAALRPEPAAHRRLARRSEDALGDEFLDLAGRLDPRALGLPGFALLRHLGAGPAAELDPARAVAAVSRQDGSLFIAARSPSIPRLGDANQWAFGLYVPTGDPRDGHP